MDMVFLDTETISLRVESDVIWEFAGIKVDSETLEEKDRVWFQRFADLSEADPFSLKIGKYHERYGAHGVWETVVYDMGPGGLNQRAALAPREGQIVEDDWAAAAMIEEFTRDCTIAGNVVSFDEARLALFLKANRRTPTWHYHVLDIEPMIVGYAKAHSGQKFTLPYSSTELTNWLGVPEPTEELRHTALGDAQWVLDQYRAMMTPQGA